MIQTILTGISPYLWQMLGVVLTAVASYVGLRLKSIYEAKVNTETKKKIVEQVVNMVEQLSKNKAVEGIKMTSEEKLQRAKDTIIEYINEKGLKITELEMDVLIESTCNSFNKAINS